MKSFYENNTVLGIVKLFLPWYCKNKYKYSSLCLVVFHIQYTIFTAMQESFYLQEQGLKADLQTAALPMESASSGDTQRKLLCFLISAPLLPIPTVSTLAPFLVSPPTSSNLVAHGLMGCPRCPNCLSWPLPRHLPAGLVSDH